MIQLNRSSPVTARRRGEAAQVVSGLYERHMRPVRHVRCIQEIMVQNGCPEHIARYDLHQLIARGFLRSYQGRVWPKLSRVPPTP